MWRLCVILFVGFVAGADNAGDGKTDQDKFQGKWTVVAVERGGRKAPEEATKNFTIAFEKDKMISHRGDQKREFPFKLDPTKKPKEIDVDIMGKKGTGIYELSGDDLKICHGEGDDPRPTEFVSKEGSNTSIITMKRAK